ncbi:pyridine nucleotide-disulfide oxidoreductase [Oesophagostomum dentatum]|uniref:Pyridine nucleotide-disulfide oxidoreductase n=1 Tax=Oesophagostomum dentatum TaxID=61180 RepID=A0A0B1SKM1_OESDE|nr:pyridine nucleotide-disulfide oxidoreductase [Oesophagostomum dentatum]
MITEDEFPPYDRVLLSKVVSVNLMHKKVTLSTGEIKPYSKLVLAMGGKPKKPSCPGGDLKNVFTLRSPSDAAAIVHACAGKRLVCVGGSFIAMELASALADTAGSVTVVCDTDEPLPFTGPDKFEENGVHVLVKSSAEKYEGIDVVTGVTTSKGETIPADVVVAGIGIYPPTEWLKGSGIETDEKGFIKVDEHFRTSADFVYAMGDVCTAPVPIWGIDSINIQHFQVAQAHGNMPIIYTQ